MPLYLSMIRKRVVSYPETDKKLHAFKLRRCFSEYVCSFRHRYTVTGTFESRKLRKPTIFCHERSSAHYLAHHSQNTRIYSLSWESYVCTSLWKLIISSYDHIYTCLWPPATSSLRSSAEHRTNFQLNHLSCFLLSSSAEFKHQPSLTSERGA